MTKEQETLERLDKLVKLRKNKAGEIKFDNCICATEDIETVLNMIKEKDKEIEHQIKKRNNQKQELAILNEKQKEMNKLINTVRSYKGMIRKKDRQINYMANFINDNTPYTKDTKKLENEEGIRTANFTTKYFERKSEEC